MQPYQNRKMEIKSRPVQETAVTLPETQEEISQAPVAKAEKDLPLQQLPTEAQVEPEHEKQQEHEAEKVHPEKKLWTVLYPDWWSKF